MIVQKKGYTLPKAYHKRYFSALGPGLKLLIVLSKWHIHKIKTIVEKGAFNMFKCKRVQHY
jgi:hypothetical protein